MQKNALTNCIAAVLSLALMATLLLWPAFRTVAQKKDKPADTKNKSAVRAGANKSAAGHSGSKNADINLQDLQNAIGEVQYALKEIQEKDWPNIQLEIENAIKEVDMQKIQKDVQAALKLMDKKEIQADIKLAMKGVEAGILDKEIAAAIKTIDMQALAKQLAQAGKMDTSALSLQLQKVQRELAGSSISNITQVEHARAEMEQANAKLLLIKEGLDKLAKAGLIAKKEKVNIEYKKGIMYLNGAAQTQEISDNYKIYFSEGNFNLNSD